MTAVRRNQIAGMKAIFVILFGQFFSILGSSMTGFAMTIWAYEKTGTATALALVGVFWMIPIILLSPFTGTIVDLVSRKKLLIISDICSVMVTLGYLTLVILDSLEMWHIYTGVVILSMFQTVQWPAFSSAMTLMIPKEHYTRINSLIGISGPGSQMVAPIIAGALLPLIGFKGIMIVDIITASLAVTTLFFIFIPDPVRKTNEGKKKNSFLEDSLDGFRYLIQRPSFIWLQSMFMVLNFIFALSVNSLLAPMILARTGSDEMVLGTVQSIGAIGGLAGGLIISAWGGYKRQIKGIFVGMFFSTLGGLIAGFGRATPGWMGIPIWGLGMFLVSAFMSLINSSNQSIWQSKVPPEMQGRVFSIRRMVAVLIDPLGGLIAGPLADAVMEPAMAEGGALAGRFDWLVGTGPGAGMALIFIFSGLGGMLLIFASSLIRPLREIESILPDHDSSPAEDSMTAKTEPA